MPPVLINNRCELLSNCIFIGFIDNYYFDTAGNTVVVNCFQIVFLSGSLTTYRPFSSSLDWLWIAFKLYFYRVHWQLFIDSGILLISCELLSNCIFIGFIDNQVSGWRFYGTVVNCFQIVFLSGSLTTMKLMALVSLLLWIAFKLYFYRVHWQLRGFNKTFTSGCELLSNCIFIGFIDNNRSYFPCVSMLWIAFKLYFYRVHWQPTRSHWLSGTGCELLSNCIFIGFIDNRCREFWICK